MVTATDLSAHVGIHRPGGFRLDVALTVPAGRTTALLGPNGAGKSTVVAAIAGLLPLDEGRIVLGGETLDDPAAGIFVPPERRRVGVVFQGAVLFPHLSVLENVAFGPRSAGMGRDHSRSRAREWIGRVGLGDLATVRADRLSGGEAQRVAIARTLASGPAALLLDEPLAALDVTVRTGLRRVLGRHLAAHPGPRLLITHDPTEAFLLADLIHIIEDGAITQSGTADEIRLSPRTPYAADLAGTNLFSGVAVDGRVRVGGHELHVADESLSGDVLVTIHPRAVALHRSRPDGSPRNTWPAQISLVEHLDHSVRVQFELPLRMIAEVTEGAVDTMQLVVGSTVWIAIKATEIGVLPDVGSSTEPASASSHDLPE